MSDSHALARKNRHTLLWLSGLVLGMFAFGFALVPLYDLFCRVTGIQSVALRTGGQAVPATMAVSNGEQAGGRLLTVKLDASVHPNLPWEISLASGNRLEVEVGKPYEVVFSARNRSNEAVTAQAIPSLTPWQADPYFNKLECFCFNRQTLAGGEVAQMPLRFVVSPQLPEGINSITLSYSLMRLDHSS